MTRESMMVSWDAGADESPVGDEGSPDWVERPGSPPVRPREGTDVSEFTLVVVGAFVEPGLAITVFVGVPDTDPFGITFLANPDDTVSVGRIGK